MTIPTQYEIDKALVSMAIEYTLLEFGKDVFDKVVKKLNDDNLTIPDCFDQPKYFNKILNDQFGPTYTTIIHSIQVWIGDSASHKLISDFLVESLKANSRSLGSEQHLTKSVIVMAIEQVLLKMGLPELKRVESKLLSDFNYTFQDCANNPTPLKKVLCELFGNCYADIYQSITFTLSDTSMDEDITKFLQTMKV